MRLQPLTWFALGILAVPMAVLLGSPTYGYENSPYGWPFPFIEFKDPPGAPPSAKPKNQDPDKPPKLEDRIKVLSNEALAADLAIVLGLLAMAGFAVERWLRRQANPPSISLRFVLAVITAVSIFCVPASRYGDEFTDRFLENFRETGFAIVVLLACCGFLDLIGMAYNTVMGRSAEPFPDAETDAPPTDE